MTVPSWAPTATEVAALIAQRTLDSTGQTQGTFTFDTIPSDTQVSELVGDVCGDILAQTGEVPAELEDAAAGCAKVGAAAQVELGFFPSEPDSVYENLKELYEARLARLREAVAEVNEGGAVDPEAPTGSPLARYSFPDVAPAVASLYPIYATTYETRF